MQNEGNYLIDGDTGTSCQSPYHNAASCEHCKEQDVNGLLVEIKGHYIGKNTLDAQFIVDSINDLKYCELQEKNDFLVELLQQLSDKGPRRNKQEDLFLYEIKAI